MANKRTDPQGEVDQKSATQAHLSNFDIDGPEVGVDGTRLKPKHIAFLNSLIQMIKGAKGQTFTIVIGGSTDTLNQTGNFNNQDLSERRAKATADFLRERLVGAPVTFDLKGFGPAIQLAPNIPDDFSRAVDVALLSSGDPKPERPRGPSPGGRAGGGTAPRPEGRGGFVFGCIREFEMPRSQAFKIRIASMAIVTAGVSATFHIVDTQRELGAVYSFVGVNEIVVLSIEAVNIRDKTAYRPFPTSKETRVTDFQSAVLRTGFGVSIANPTGPVPKPTITLTFKDKDGFLLQATSEIDMKGKEGAGSRIIKGSLTMDTKCRAVRGAEEVSRTNTFP
jgi:hypothetical protein